jgi:hypothetical protein
MNSNYNLGDQDRLDQIEMGPEKALVKIIDRSKKSKSQGKNNARNYTLDCERRLEAFKEEFRNLFDKQLESNYGSFDEHYRHVL